MTMPVGRLPLSATVSQKTATADGYGGRVTTWATRHSGFRCRIYSHSKEEPIRLASGEQAFSTHKLIGEDKEIHAGDQISAGGANYEVLGPDYPANRIYDSSLPHHVEVFLRAI